MTMSSRERSTAQANMPANSHEWSTEDEIQLFCALDGLKPIGINKHFYMALITERLSKSLNRDIPAEAIWSHLRSLYNLDLLDDKEPLPFPNDEKEFSLPETEFADLMQKKKAESEEKSFNNESTTTTTVAAAAAAAVATTTSTSAANTSSRSLNSSLLSSSSLTNENITKGETAKGNSSTPNITQPWTKELDKKVATKLSESKRGPKRTRGSVSNESPSTTPPPVHNVKRRRI